MPSLQAQGFRADGAQYSAVLVALMAAGVLPAQLKALQLFQTALRQGILRCAPLRWKQRFGAPVLNQHVLRNLQCYLCIMERKGEGGMSHHEWMA